MQFKTISKIILITVFIVSFQKTFAQIQPNNTYEAAGSSTFYSYWNESLVGASVSVVLKAIPEAQPNRKPASLLNGAVDYVTIPTLSLGGINYSANFFFLNGKLSQMWLKSDASLSAEKAKSSARKLSIELDKMFVESEGSYPLLNNSSGWKKGNTIVSLLVNESNSNSGALTILFQNANSLGRCSNNRSRNYLDRLCVKNIKKRVENKQTRLPANNENKLATSYARPVLDKKGINTLDAGDAVGIRNEKCEQGKTNTYFSGTIQNISQYSTYRATLTIEYLYSSGNPRNKRRYDKKKKTYTLKPDVKYPFEFKSKMHSENIDITCDWSLSIRFVDSTVKR